MNTSLRRISVMIMVLIVLLLANYVLLAILVCVSHAARRPLTGKPTNNTPIAAASTEVIGRV